MVRIMVLSCLVLASCGASSDNNENDPEVVINIQPTVVRPTLGDDRCYHCQLPPYQQQQTYPNGFPQPMPRTVEQPSMKDMCQWNGQERAWYCQQDLTSCLIHSTHRRDTGYPAGIRTTISQVRKCFVNRY